MIELVKQSEKRGCEYSHPLFIAQLGIDLSMIRLKTLLSTVSVFLLIHENVQAQQTDTLNQVNPSGRKHGYWTAYLDARLRPVKANGLVEYEHLVLFDNGKRITPKLKQRKFFQFRKDESDSLNTASVNSKLLSGTYLYYSSTRDGIPLLKRDWIFQYNQRYGWLQKEMRFENGILAQTKTFSESGKVIDPVP